MRSTTSLVIIALLAGGVGTAQADIYEYATPVSGTTSDFAENAFFTPASFNSSLGQLTAVGLTFTGTVDVSDLIVNGQGGYPIEPGLYFTQSAVLVGGFAQTPYKPNVNIEFEPGVIGTGYVTASGIVDASFAVASGHLKDFIGNGSPDPSLFGYITFNSTVFTPSGLPYGMIPFPDNPSTVFTGHLYEDFTYTPNPVPEPGSLALLGTGAVLLAGAVKTTKRRKRPE